MAAVQSASSQRGGGDDGDGDGDGLACDDDFDRRWW